MRIRAVPHYFIPRHCLKGRVTERPEVGVAHLALFRVHRLHFEDVPQIKAERANEPSTKSGNRDLRGRLDARWRLEAPRPAPGDIPPGEFRLPERSEERRVGKECRSRWS